MTLQPPFINQTFEGAIWRLHIDELTGIMVAEIRDEQQKQASFASFSLLTGIVYFTGFKTPERWLTGAEGIYNGVVLLHYYKHETSPEHKALIAIDAVTCAEIWSNYSLAFDHFSINGPIVYQTGIQPKKLLLADIATGQLKRPYEAAIDKELANSIILPAMSTPDGHLMAGLPVEPYGNMMHYLTYNNYRIVSLHTFKTGILQQHLFILDASGVIYHDLLNTDIQKLQPEAFVLHKNALVYIKNKVELKVLNL